MWNKDRSIVLSRILVKICYVIVAACAVAAPRLVELCLYNTAAEARGEQNVYTALLITLYACVPPAIAALVFLDILLRNIRENRPFIEQNVKLLRGLSYCCFCVAAAFAFFSLLRPFALLVVFAAGFFGIILRVVKNCFQQAVAIREENDFTI